MHPCRPAGRKNPPVVSRGVKSGGCGRASGLLQGLEDLFRTYGIKEMTRTGKVAMSRSSKE